MSLSVQLTERNGLPGGAPRAPRSARRIGTRIAAAAGVLAMALVAGCGSGEPASGGSPSAPAQAGDSFPVSLTHALGTTEIPAAPVRVVALSEADQDAALALGVQLVGTIETLGGDEMLPYTKAAVSQPPTVLPIGDNGVAIEQVAALKPDLILAGFDYNIDAEYAQLSKIAPTTAYEGAAASTDPWQTTLRQVGKALGRSAEAEKLVGEVEAKVKGAADPAFAGKQFTFVSVSDTSTVGVLKSTEDAGVKLLSELGLVPSPKATSLPGEGFAAQLSLEHLDAIDSDVLLANFSDDQVRASIEANPLFSQLGVVTRGGYQVLTLEEFWAIRNPTALSVPFAIDSVSPKLRAAVSGA